MAGQETSVIIPHVRNLDVSVQLFSVEVMKYIKLYETSIKKCCNNIILCLKSYIITKEYN